MLVRYTLDVSQMHVRCKLRQGMHQQQDNANDHKIIVEFARPSYLADQLVLFQICSVVSWLNKTMNWKAQTEDWYCEPVGNSVQVLSWVNTSQCSVNWSLNLSKLPLVGQFEFGDKKTKLDTQLGGKSQTTKLIYLQTGHNGAPPVTWSIMMTQIHWS